MLKLSTLWFFFVVMITASLLLCFQFFKGTPIIAETSEVQTFDRSATIATASTPPKLVPAFLGGKPVHVLYVTQPEDTILVRCYPTYEPTLELRAMGSNSNTEPQQEGVLTCRPST